MKQYAKRTMAGWRRYRSGRQSHCYGILSLEQWQASESRGCISSFRGGIPGIIGIR